MSRKTLKSGIFHEFLLTDFYICCFYLSEILDSQFSVVRLDVCVKEVKTTSKWTDIGENTLLQAKVCAL